MKRSLGIAVIAAVLAVPAAFAASGSKTITLPAVTVGSTSLPAGDYRLTWTGTAPNVQLTLAQKISHNPLTATVPATLEQQKNGQDQVLTNNQAGVVKLESIQLKDVTFHVTGSPSSGQ